MAIEVFNRYEMKYVIEDAVFQALYQRLSDHMIPDQYGKNGAFYTISNLYYDTPDNDLIRISLDKPVYKEKLRLRCYGKKLPELFASDHSDMVFLEIKKKFDGLVNKRRTKLRLSDAYRFFSEPESYSANGALPDYMNRQVTREIAYLPRLYRELKPAVYLSYDRCALFGRDGSDVRITFDKNILARRYDLGLEYGSYGDLVLPDGKWIMEIKVSQAQPLWLSRLLAEYHVYPRGFSKYGTEYAAFLGQTSPSSSQRSAAAPVSARPKRKARLPKAAAL